jgi:hypothetical protein
MKIGLACASLAAVCFAGAAMADLRPMARPAAIAEVSLAPPLDLRPLTRPDAVGPTAAAMPVDPSLLAALRSAPVPMPDFFASVRLDPPPLAPLQFAMLPLENPVLSVSTSGQVAPMILRPRVRPEGVENVMAAVVVTPPGALPLSRTLRPEARPAVQQRRAEEPEAEVIPAAVVRVLPGKEGIFGKKGSICGDPSIKGQTIAPITSRVRGCGVDEAVMVTSVSGVKLSEAATIDCNTARALNAWVQQGLQPQFSRDPVVQLRVAGHYTCRPRNNIKGNKISEHGKGKAIDISGFVLASGELVTIASDWRSKAEGRLIKAAHKAACGVFNTTLGPGSDGYHEDHLHFDTASGRGPYCR